MLLAIYILFLHFIGDFVLQSDWMAQNKSKSWFPLTVHIFVYGAALRVGLQSFDSGLYVLVNALAHYLIDTVTSRWTSALWKEGKVHWFFVVIGADQFAHVALLLGTISLIK